MSAEDVAVIRAAKQKIIKCTINDEEETEIPFTSASVHFSAGMFVRNSWSLWAPDSPLKRDAVERYGIAHADDISGLIFDWVFAEVRGETFDPKKTCDRYHEHWRKYGTNSLEAGGWPPKTK